MDGILRIIVRWMESSPRKKLIEQTYFQLLGEESQEGGHYVTIWAPRQTGKTWLMQQVLNRLKKKEQFLVVKLNLEHLKRKTEELEILKSISHLLIRELNLQISPDEASYNFSRA